MMVQVVSDAAGRALGGLATTSTTTLSLQVSSNPLSAFAQVCGDLAPFAADAVFLAPLPTIQTVNKNKSVGNLPLVPYTAMISNCFIWCVYGYLKREPKLWSINLIGLVMGLTYFVSFARHVPRRGSSGTTTTTTLPGTVSQHLQVMLAVIGGTLLIVTAIPDPQVALSLIGSIGILFAISLAASPLAALKTVLQTKSARAIPLPFTMASLINGFLWGVFGLFAMRDVNIYVPNVLGFLCAVAQLVLKIKFGNKPPTLAM